MNFTGRYNEIQVIRDHLDDESKAKLVIVYGRRRVGKSTLIREALQKEKKKLFFEGIEGEDTAVQIDQFLSDLSRQTGRVKLAARNWRESFQGLGETIGKGRWTVVFDEFPWMASGRSRLVADLKLYWDRWMTNPQLTLFLCGSVAQFMVEYLVHSKAFHNRKTMELCLDPLSPRESGLFIPRRSLFEKAQLYMTFGGIPKYLEQINPKISIEKNINQLCFTANGFFIQEFETLFKEQFKAVHTYESMVAHLSQGPLSISVLSRKMKVLRGGGFQGQLSNLVRAQFVREYSPHNFEGKKKGRTKIYKLVDPFLLFYFRYIRPHRDLIRRNKTENLFKTLVGPSQHTYYGLAFERLCEDALDDILKEIHLPLAEIKAMAPYFQQGNKFKKGLQIDQLIMRRDHVWTLMEYKYSPKPMDREVIVAVQEKIQKLSAPKHISIEPVLISASGVTPSVKKEGFFSSILTLQDLVG